ncbi:mediator complex subunit Med19 [Schizosaccharomyces pombe]|uniref:Mediator of RNA polymerase II transcription subunit 19 n=1 Tax=Schizosaccharomyces pombe (strain 972 / ATCC 24843) TaxID=284812 RepID=MED19_SCHPO|nr:mediator complex subunit Med19/Rox3 [Schizosaccharomyces pombe]Q9Y7N2.1 RecName: Full=Mediator of RNA polymerase II transcription subunit 19; AltName: Full=Mediator complex subunit 19; AltName: Full=RNA polymerase II mediator complex protein rox3 [Schizosaccharomyces pombe 972h-]5N9J_C Chain C, Mediator of RNA polymerase II transcription subunit 19 [Schizosaccharomyces pombe]CAB40172.1 mediator complex subunit Med19/Rox3 [Schizosaccharomyces pombe]|eukprot:NP_588304.1 mediator complex subunit Med19/Rox3 [Schizosaccharomyces pombe]
MAQAPEYHYVGSVDYQPTRPSAHQNLIELYGLTELAKKVGRVDEFGNKRKMRRSYKAYIQDLPGYNEILRDNTIKQWLTNPIREEVPIDIEFLHHVFSVEPGIIPGFNPKVFGLEDDVVMGNVSRDSSQPRSPSRRKK